MNKIKITLTGIKSNDGYIPCRFGLDDNDNVWVYAKEYGDDIPAELGKVINESDSMTDYFEKDRVLVMKDNQFYAACYRSAINGFIKRCKAEIKDRERWIKQMPYYAEEYKKEIEDRQTQMAAWQAIFNKIA